MKILIVDDDEQLLRMMARLLGQRGHAVETSLGPFGASATALRQLPDLVLLDVMMPALDGPRLSVVLENAPLDPRPQLVMWSSDDEAVTRLKREGRYTILSKKDNPKDVIFELERLHSLRKPV